MWSRVPLSALSAAVLLRVSEIRRVGRRATPTMLEELSVHVQALRRSSGNPSDRIPHQLVEVMEAIQAVLMRIDNHREEPDAHPHLAHA